MSERKIKLPMKPCIICGELFQPSKINHNCCSQKCRKINFRMQTQSYNERQLEIKRANKSIKKEKTNHEKIADIAIAAREEGLTYGQYVAQQYISERMNKNNE